jgi:hypothetical protein
MENKETRKLSVKLTEDETRAKGLELAAEVANLEDSKDSLKSVSKSMKDQIEIIERKISILVQIVKTGKEDRDVECIEIRNETLMTMETYRTDLHELVETRPMTVNERQLTMFPSKLIAVPDIPRIESPVSPVAEITQNIPVSNDDSTFAQDTVMTEEEIDKMQKEVKRSRRRKDE